MNISRSLIAAAVIVALPLSAFAGDKDKTPAMGTTVSAQFATLDANRDGRISQMEASNDSTIMFSSADRNADGFLDSNEFAHRDMSKESMPETGNPATDTDKPRK